MDTPVKKQPDISTPGQQAATESHYHSKKDRIFVRGIAGQYSLKDELQRLRSMPRVIKGKDLDALPDTLQHSVEIPSDTV